MPDKKRALLIEDSKNFRNTVRRNLGRKGIEVFVEASGPEGLVFLATNNVDIVLLDNGLTDEMDGVSTAKLIRQYYPKLPMIMLTGSESVKLAVTFMQCGGNDFVTKPPDYDILELQINKVIAYNQSNQKIEQLQLEMEAVEKANQAKSDFLAKMSHELRTPLHVILSFAYFVLRDVKKCSSRLKNKEINEEILRVLFDHLMDYIGEIDRAGGNLLKMIDQLLDLAKLEAGKMEFVMQETDLKKVVKNEVSSIKALLEEKELTVKIEVTASDTLVQADEEKIQQVIRNFLSNALKFSPKGHQISISFQDMRLNDEPVIATSVADQGVGISENDSEAVFDKFFQINKANQGNKGTGLGLAISKEIVEAHLGKIWAENNVENGATFSFALPIKKAI